jgi:hypothetical protein
LNKSIEALNNAVDQFQQIYVEYKNKTNFKDCDDEAMLAALDQATAGSVFDRAAAFGKAITATITQRFSLQEIDSSAKKSMCQFLARLFPLIKILLDLGGSASQVATLFNVL